MLNKQPAQSTEQEQGIRKTMIKACIGLVLMFGFAFALVPLYQLICDVTGLNGNTSNLKRVAGEANDNIDKIVVDRNRQVTMQLVAIKSKHVPFDFETKTEEVKLNPGDIKTFYYRVKNLTNKNMVVQAVPSVSPNLASTYVRKLECFCFTAQPLSPGEEAQLFVNLYIHEKLPKDINELTLAYTLFDITDKQDFKKLSAATSKGRGAAAPNIDYSTVKPHDDGDHEHTENIDSDDLKATEFDDVGNLDEEQGRSTYEY